MHLKCNNSTTVPFACPKWLALTGSHLRTVCSITLSRKACSTRSTSTMAKDRTLAIWTMRFASVDWDRIAAFSELSLSSLSEDYVTVFVFCRLTRTVFKMAVTDPNVDGLNEQCFEVENGVTTGRSEDYLFIPAAVVELPDDPLNPTGATRRIRATRYCGTSLTKAIGSLVSSPPGPFQLIFNSDRQYYDNLEVGFRFQYSIVWEKWNWLDFFLLNLPLPSQHWIVFAVAFLLGHDRIKISILPNTDFFYLFFSLSTHSAMYFIFVQM